jgi:protein involved in plasmid replication-relaxation
MVKHSARAARASSRRATVDSSLFAPVPAASAELDDQLVQPSAPARSPRAAQRITSRDEQILGWLCRQRFATAEQIGLRFAIGRNRCARRLGELAAAGLLERAQPFQAPSVYLVTSRALRFAGAALPAPRVDVRTFRHDRGVTGLVVEFELAGAETITEREMRAPARGRSEPYTVAFAGSSPRSPRRHFPDLLVRSAGRVTAVELELTAKRTRRLRSILKAYRRAEHIDAVLYLSDRQPLLATLEQLGRELHLEHKLCTRAWGER